MENNEKELNQFEKTIQTYLERMASEDEAFGLQYEKAVAEGKTIGECCNYIYEQVQESGRMGFDDSEIYGMAVHFYDEDEIKPGGRKSTPGRVIVNHAIELTEEQKEQIRKEAEAEFRRKALQEIEERERKRKEAKKAQAEAEAKAVEEATLF